MGGDGAALPNSLRKCYLRAEEQSSALKTPGHVFSCVRIAVGSSFTGGEAELKANILSGNVFRLILPKS